jgi:lysophospholipase L1-like esterase
MLAKKLALALASVLVFFGICEGLVRLTDYDEKRIGDPFRKEKLFSRWLAPDTYLQWRMRPNAGLIWSTERLNSRGFRGPEVAPRKGPGARRVAVLGDSCTFGIVLSGQGTFDLPEPYPGLLQKILDRNFGPGRFEVINYSAIGYTSFHGLRRLRRDVLPDEPDVVVIRFGWNDQLVSPVGHSFENPSTPLGEWVEEKLYRSRLLAMLMYQGMPQARVRPDVFKNQAEPLPWVTREAFEHNLARMIDLARAHGARVIVLDAPAAPLTPEIRADRKFVTISGYDTIEHMLAMHARYQAIAERVAKEKGVPFLRTDDPPGPGEPPHWTPHDVVHPSQAGHFKIARRLYGEIASMFADEVTR